MKKNIVFWVEEYLYNPNRVQKILSVVLLPLSWLYCLIVYLRYKSKVPEDMGIAVISVGNLTLGGSGKTPLVSALAQRYSNVAIVLRGYGRKSRGLIVIKDAQKILCDVERSGDEAMIYAQKIAGAIVIVSEDRKEGIKKAKEMGAALVFLDDAYSKHEIKKLDFLIDVDSGNQNCLPSGPFREKVWGGKEAILLKEQKDFTRVVQLKNKSDKMSLVTAIARGGRLDPYLPELVSKNYFEDHHRFRKEELQEILKRDRSESLLVTYKDYVKVESFGLPLSLLDLDVEVDESVFTKIDLYKKGYDAKKD